MKRKRDAVRAFLAARGAADHVVEGGLEGLVARWEKAAEDAAHGRTLGLDDWRNDLDGRQILARVLEVATEQEAAAIAERLDVADKRMNRATTPLGCCVWTDRRAEREGWSPEAMWWYFVKPRRLDAEFAKELGVLADRRKHRE